MLLPSDLELVRYFFPVQNVVAHPDPSDEGRLALSEYELKADLNWTFDDDLGRYKFTVLLVMRNHDELDEDEYGRYNYELVVVGIFGYSPENGEPVEEEWIPLMEEHAKVIACQVLFGAMRERLAELTSRGPWGPLFLDTFNASEFVDLPSAADQQDSDLKAGKA